MTYRIENIDRNFMVESTIGEPDVKYYDVRQEPFALYGFYHPTTEPIFRRLPVEIAKKTSPKVEALHTNCAGGRVRFCTDSQYVAIKAQMPFVCKMPHMTMTNSAGFDLYIDLPQTGESRFWRPFKPSMDITDGYESKIEFETAELRYFTINFPSYSNVSSLWIGLTKDATLAAGMPYQNIPPIVYYGSSITQGASASHPGNAYQNIIGRHLNIDFINLGFSGSAHAEEELIRYIATLNMSVFVSDYDHNSPDPNALEHTHFQMYQLIREKQPNTPYLMLSRPDFDIEINRKAYNENVSRRNIVMDSYQKARATGDQNVYLIDGSAIFRGRYEELCTVDGIHPNDLGYTLMADAIENEIRRTFFR